MIAHIYIFSRKIHILLNDNLVNMFLSNKLQTTHTHT